MFTKLLHLPFAKDYTIHSFRQTRAKILEDAGVDMINLKRMGRWKSDSCVEGYLANSKYLKQKQSVTIVKELEAAVNHTK